MGTSAKRLESSGLVLSIEFADNEGVVEGEAAVISVAVDVLGESRLVVELELLSAELPSFFVQATANSEHAISAKTKF